MKEQKMTDEQLSQELNKSKGGRIGGKLLSLLGRAVILFGIILGGDGFFWVGMGGGGQCGVDYYRRCIAGAGPDDPGQSRG